MQKTKAIISGNMIEILEYKSRTSSNHHFKKTGLNFPATKLCLQNKLPIAFLLDNNCKYNKHQLSIRRLFIPYKLMKFKPKINELIKQTIIYPKFRSKKSKRKNSNNNRSIKSIRYSKSRFRKLVHANISEHSKFLTLNTNTQDIKHAMGTYRTFLKRFKYTFKHINLRYISVPEIGVENGNIHFHIIIFNIPQNIDIEVLNQIHECINIRNVYTHNHPERLINYLSKQFNSTSPFTKLFYSSKNLTKPIEITDVQTIELMRSERNLIKKDKYKNNYVGEIEYELYR